MDTSGEPREGPGGKPGARRGGKGSRQLRAAVPPSSGPLAFSPGPSLGSLEILQICKSKAFFHDLAYVLLASSCMGGVVYQLQLQVRCPSSFINEAIYGLSFYH